MPRFIKKVSRKAGMSPGTLIHIGDQKVETVRLSSIDYSPSEIVESTPASVADALKDIGDGRVRWLNIDGLHQVDVIGAVGAQLDVHPLVMEDILNTAQRPKIEVFDRYIYAVVKMIHFDGATARIRSEQVSLLFGEDFMVSFQEAAGDVFDTVRERLRAGRGKLRQRGADYLAYALLDAVVDQYFLALEGIGDAMEAVEIAVADGMDADVLPSIHRFRHDIVYLRKQIWPVRDLMGVLRKIESPLVHPDNGIFFSDVYDHALQAVELVESLRDLLSAIHDLYLSQLSNRMNEVMKVLTIIATIFIPLSFIAGVYGMNFKIMPELDLPWGYPAALLLMAAVGGGLLLYFRRRRWL
jgi:magnesium transporter